MNQRPRMLEGIKVLDFTHWVAGPTCTRILAEMGAEVIKLERSPEGDHVRQLGLVRGPMSTYYFQHNHSKKSLAIDLRKPRGLELAQALAAKADVLVENFAPGVIADMGLGYEAVRALNPRIIMCSISVAGQTGPLRTLPGYDYLGAAYAGIIDQIGEADRPPSVPAMAIGDTSTGVAAAMAIGFALFDRERTGEGAWLDASLLDTYFHMHEMSVPVLSLRPDRFIPRRNGGLHPTGSPSGVYQARGGFILLIVQQHEIKRLWRAMGRPELGEDPRFVNNRERLKNNLELKRIIEEWLAGFPDRDSALRVLERERVPCAPVFKLAEALAHPHLRERGTVRRASDPAMGEFDLPGMPVKFSSWPAREGLRASRVGEDNAEVLGGILGLGEREIEELYQQGVLLRSPAPVTPAR